MSNTDEDTKRARAIAAKLHKAADQLVWFRDTLREVEILLKDETFEATRVQETSEIRKIREATTFLLRPTLTAAYNWDGYAEARSRP